MKKMIIPILAVLMIAAACKKYNSLPSDAESDLYIYGRLFIRDSLNDNGAVRPLNKQADLTLTYKSDTSKVLYTTQSSADGYFKFQNLKKETYIVSAKVDKGENDFKVFYTGADTVQLDVSKTNSTPILTLDRTGQNGVLFTVRDTTGGYINATQICFFSSKQLWNRDTCNYSLFSITTNEKGQAVKTNILPGLYYILLKRQAGSLLLQRRDSIIVPAKGIKDTTMIIK